MRKGEFDLTGKAIDCTDLIDNPWSEIVLDALRDFCKGELCRHQGSFKDLSIGRQRYMINFSGFITFTDEEEIGSCEVIDPSDVLGQAAIDAAIDGATILFEGDVIPPNNGIKSYYTDGESRVWIDEQEESIELKEYDEGSLIVAYKIIEEKPSIESRVLSEKIGFKELCPVCSTDDWQEREAETYDDLRDAHLELIRDGMAKDIEIESLKSRIKELERARNDAKAALDV